MEPKIEMCELWSLWEADLWKMQKAFADYAALDRPADCPEDGYTIFSYRLHTTEDFYQEVCRYGSYMEVLYPGDVREEMMKIIKGMGDEYAGVSRKDCKKRVPGVKELKALMEDPEQ